MRIQSVKLHSLSPFQRQMQVICRIVQLWQHILPECSPSSRAEQLQRSRLLGMAPSRRDRSMLLALPKYPL